MGMGSAAGLSSFVVWLGELELGARREVDESGQFDLGGGEFLLDAFEDAQVFQHGALIAQGFQRVADAFLFDLAGIGQGGFGQADGFAQILVDLLGAGGAPVSGAHFLDQVVHGFAPALAGDQHAVGVLL